jgi:hypothetical protein
MGEQADIKDASAQRTNASFAGNQASWGCLTGNARRAPRTHRSSFYHGRALHKSLAGWLPSLL